MKVVIETLFEDDELIFINKPANYLSIPDRYDPEKINLSDYLRSKYPYILPVHRLDFETSGVICFAKNTETHQILNQQFENRLVNKKYHALIHGNLVETEGTIDLPLKTLHNGKVIVSDQGKSAITHYKVINHYTYYSHVEIDLETGRTHQIRVHFSTLGHPLVGDSKYGGKDFYLSQIKKKYSLAKNKIERPILSRTALHAHSLEILHPISNQSLQVQAPLTKDIRVAIKQLEKYT